MLNDHLEMLEIQTPVVKTHAKKVLWSLLATAVVGYGLIGGFFYKSVWALESKIFEHQQGGLLGQIGALAASQHTPLKGEDKDRINILLLGYGGAGHQGGGLTDTIMVMSIKPSTHQVAMISIPRDFQANFGGSKPADQKWLKMNGALDYGGIKFAKKTVEDITGLNINYYLTVDFDGFKQVIDDLGGVELYVENAFTDRQYPDYNYGYQTVNFALGNQTMNGEKALQYARSRHGNHGEGSDYARARRQQIIISAVRTKLLSAGTLLNPLKLNSIFNDLGDHIRTDAELWEIAKLAAIAKDVDSSKIINKVLDDSATGLLKSEIVPENGAFILIPAAGLGNFSEIKAMAASIFEQPATPAEPANIVVENGTKVNGLGAKGAAVLRNDQLHVTTITNATIRDSAISHIFDLTGGTKTDTLTQIETDLGINASQVTALTQDQLDASVVDVKDLPPNTNFVVILGTDYSTMTATPAPTQ